MRGWGRLVVAITAALIAGAGPTIAQTRKPPTTALAPADAAALRSKIIAFYSAYRDIQMRPGGGIAHDAAEPSQDHLFTAGTEAIASENSELLAAAGGGAGDIDADVFTDGNDHGTIHVLSVSFQPRPDGRVASLVVFNDSAMTEHSHRKTIVWERTPAGWRVYDVMLSGQDTYRNVMLAENKRLRAEQTPRAPARSRPPARAHAAARTAPVTPPPLPPVDLVAEAMRFGTYRFTGDPDVACPAFWSQEAVGERNALLPTFRAPELRRVLDRYHCGSDLAYYELGVSFMWEHNAVAAKPYLQQAIAIAKGNTTPSILVCRKNRSCGFAVSVEAEPVLKQATGVINGFMAWDPLPVASTPASSPTGQGQAPLYLVTVVGRNRLVAVRGDRCSPDAQLKRDYCFGEAIAQLRSHPELRDTTVVTVEQPWAAGTWVSRKAGLNFDLFKITRAGPGFRADRELAYGTRAGAPLGCSPGMQTDSGWIITVEDGQARAAEAARYACDQPIDTRSGVAPIPTTLAAVMAGA